MTNHRFINNSDKSANHPNRKAKVLAIGSGPFMLSLIGALFASGLSKFQVLITDSVPTDRQRMAALIEHARETDPKAKVEEIFIQEGGKDCWRETVRPFHSIAYVSQAGEVEQLQMLNEICKAENKALFPAIFVLQAGLAGPMVHPDSEGCWESAWRRVHRSALSGSGCSHAFPPAAGALLANVIASQLVKSVAGACESEMKNCFFLLEPQSLTGRWHSFTPHPLVTGRTAVEWVPDFSSRLESDRVINESNEWFAYFSRLTSPQSGIFHIWEEEELIQLPLSQCRVQAADPLSDGPAELLPDIVSIAFTHEEARREAGLAGIEDYASRIVRMLIRPKEYIGVGAGETFAECMYRGLHTCLNAELGKRLALRKPVIRLVNLVTLEDERCQFYIQALTTMQGTPLIGLEEEIFGFPVVWVSSGGHWYGCASLSMKRALRRALEQALQQAQNVDKFVVAHGIKALAIDQSELAPLIAAIPGEEEATYSELLNTAIQILKQNRMYPFLFDLVLDPFVKGEPVMVCGVILREEILR